MFAFLIACQTPESKTPLTFEKTDETANKIKEEKHIETPQAHKVTEELVEVNGHKCELDMDSFNKVQEVFIRDESVIDELHEFHLIHHFYSINKSNSEIAIANIKISDMSFSTVHYQEDNNITDLFHGSGTLVKKLDEKYDAETCKDNYIYNLKVTYEGRGNEYSLVIEKGRMVGKKVQKISNIDSGIIINCEPATLKIPKAFE